MARKGSMLGFEQTLMYGQYREELGEFAKFQARKLKTRKSDEKFLSKGLKENAWIRKLTACFSSFWKHTFARIGEDWVFLALLGFIMAILSFIMDYCIYLCLKTRLWLYEDLTGDNIILKFLVWILMPLCLILFASGFVHIISPQAIGSGIPEMKTILRGVILNEYLTFRTLVAKMIGLTCSLGSGLPLGKEGPFVHVASIVATLLSKLVTSFKGIYENESRTGEMLAAACAVGVASTFYAPIGGVLFSIEVTSVFFAVRNYWRGFFAATCGAALWRLMGVWFRNEEAITALFKTHFRADFPFDPQELFVFALIGIGCGFAGAGYVTFHRKIVNFFRSRKKLSKFLQKSRFIYPGIITVLLSTVSFPMFLGQYMAEGVSTHDQISQLFSNITWGSSDDDPARDEIIKNWSTERTSFYFNLIFYMLMLTWMSLLASTIPIPCGVFIPVFKMGAIFGRLIGELMALIFPSGIPFGGYTNQIVPGGYAVVGAAAMSGAVTHTISTCVIVFELTGQMTHIIPVIIAVLIANAIAQTLELSIYDSIIQIKKLPFLPPILSTSSAAHNVLVEDIMIRDVAFVWKNCTYRDLNTLLKSHKNVQSFPFVDDGKNMILLGSVQRQELSYLTQHRLSRERRLMHIKRKNIVEDTLKKVAEKAAVVSMAQSSNDTPKTRRMSRFEVTPVEHNSQVKELKTPPSPNRLSPKTPVKSILKHTMAITYSPHNTITMANQDSRLRQAFENIFLKSLKLQDANPEKNGKPEKSDNSNHNTLTMTRRVQLPQERVIDMSPEEQLEWEEEQLNKIIDLSPCRIDPAPFQLVERTSLLKVHSLFSMLGLSHAYVTSIGRLVGVVALKDLRNAIEKMNAGVLVSNNKQTSNIDSDDHYEDTVTSNATSNESEHSCAKNVATNSV